MQYGMKQRTKQIILLNNFNNLVLPKSLFSHFISPKITVWARCNRQVMKAGKLPLSLVTECRVTRAMTHWESRHYTWKQR